MLEDCAHDSDLRFVSADDRYIASLKVAYFGIGLCIKGLHGLIFTWSLRS